MSRFLRWGLLVGASALASSCQLGLEGRACGSDGDDNACMAGWSCCSNVCSQDCSKSADLLASAPEDVSSSQAVAGNPPEAAESSVPSREHVSMDVVVGDNSYSFFCDQGSSSVSDVGENGGVGPLLDTASNRCEWPANNPRLWLDVVLRDFLASKGPPIGTWDLAAPETIFPLRITFIASVGGEIPVGQSAAYQYYESTAPLEAGGAVPSVTRAGFYQSPRASGSVTISHLSQLDTTGQRYGALDSSDGSSDLYLIELSNVTLSADGKAAPESTEPFPETVTIRSASLTVAF